MSKHAYAKGDVIEFMTDEADQSISAGMTAKVVKLCGDGDVYVTGADCDGDMNGWYVRPDGSVLETEHVLTRLLSPSGWVEPGMQVLCHGALEEDGEPSIEGRIAEVLKGPDGDGDYYCLVLVKDDDGNEIAESFYVKHDGVGIEEHYHVTPVTTSSVGITVDETDFTIEHEVDLKVVAPVVRCRIEFGHINPNGVVFPTPPEMPPNPHPIRINGQMCQPVQRKIETHTYPWVTI